MKKKPQSTPAKSAGSRRKAAVAPYTDGLVLEAPAVYPAAPPPARAKTFRVGGSQAVRLPKAFRLPDGEVTVEKRGDEIVLKPVPKKTLTTENEIREWLRYLVKNQAELSDDWELPARPGPETHRPIADLTW